MARPSLLVTTPVGALLAQLDQAYDRRSWHGTNLRGSLRGVSAAQAAWRPGAGRHNIWEIALHAAYWKYAVWRRLTGEPRGSFGVEGSNWFERPGAGPLATRERAWRGDLAVLGTAHARLRDAVAALSPSSLARRPPGARTTAFDLVSGIVAHDLYHAGQVQLLKRLSPPVS